MEQGRPIDRGKRWRLGDGWNPQPRFEQIFGKGRGMIAAPPCAGEKDGWTGGAQSCSQVSDQGLILLILSGYNGGRFARFGMHLRRASADRHTPAF